MIFCSICQYWREAAKYKPKLGGEGEREPMPLSWGYCKRRSPTMGNDDGFGVFPKTYNNTGCGDGKDRHG